MAIELTDDGTLDTVLRCTDCGAEMRYNYDPTGSDGCTDCDGTGRISSEEYPGLGSIPCAACDGTGNTPDDYEAFIAGCIEDAESEHVCASDEPSEPEDFYVCWNCGQEATYSRPHACDTNH